MVEGWPKHFGHHYAKNLYPYNQSPFVGVLIYLVDLIKARNMNISNEEAVKFRRTHKRSQVIRT